MYQSGQEITITWILEPTANPLSTSDFDIRFIGGDYNATYTDAEIINHVPPTEFTCGSIQFKWTPLFPGRHQVYLTCGIASAYLILDKKDFWVFCEGDLPTTEPSTEVFGVNPIIAPPGSVCPVPEAILQEAMRSPSELNLDFFGVALDITDTHLAIGYNDNVRIYTPDGVLLRTITNAEFTNGLAHPIDVVALNSTQVLISNGGITVDSQLNAGKAWVYNLATGALVHEIPNSGLGTQAQTFFGRAADFNDDHIIIGCPNHNGAGGASNGGRVYRFNATTGAFIQIVQPPIAPLIPDHFFGHGISISPGGSFFAVGERGGIGEGKVYLYDPGLGTHIATIDNPVGPPGTAFTNFGYTVAVTETHLLIGAPGEGNPVGAAGQDGVAYIFNPNTASLIHTLVNPNSQPDVGLGDRFGEGFDAAQGVALSSKYAIVNAWNEEGPGNESLSGVAYIFDLTTGLLFDTLINPNDFGSHAGDVFGRAVGITDTRVIVGAPLEDSTGIADLRSGAAYRYNIIS